MVSLFTSAHCIEVFSFDSFPDDVVRARLKTMGVSDYSFVIDRGV